MVDCRYSVTADPEQIAKAFRKTNLSRLRPLKHDSSCCPTVPAGVLVGPLIRRAPVCVCHVTGLIYCSAGRCHRMTEPIVSRSPCVQFFAVNRSSYAFCAVVNHSATPTDTL